jgi:hypothetical protein
MATTSNTYTGNGSNKLFSITFPYLDTSDIDVYLNGTLQTIITQYTFANATTVEFVAAPANGAVILLDRSTDDATLQATFFPGSSIKASDLNDDFDQVLYIAQETSNEATTATTTAATATTTANTALSQSAAAVSTANTASSNASAAVSTANTASTNASNAVTTANTASSNATTAVNTANAATSTANTASSNASAAVSTANTASSNASAAVSTANTASSNASAAVSTANAANSTANTASGNASTAVTTANNAVTTANTANSNSNTAVTTANAAAAAVANAVLYTTVANVAAIPGSPANNAAVEVTNSTGIESFTPLSGLPAGFIGSSGLSVRIIYQTSGATWTWIQYFPNDPETRYLKLAGGTLTGTLAHPLGAAATPSITFTGDTNTGIYSPGADQVAISTGGTVRLTSSTTAISSALPIDVPLASAATPSITFTGDLNTGIYSPGADQVAISTGGSGRLFVDASGRILAGLSSSSASAAAVFQGFAGSPAGQGIIQLQVGKNTAATGPNENLGSLRLGNSDANLGALISAEAESQWSSNNYPSRLTFWTTAASGSSPTERLRITSAGLVGIGTSSPGAKLVVDGGTSGDQLRLGTDPHYYKIGRNSASGPLEFYGTQSGVTGYVFGGVDGTRLTIDSSGRVGIGVTGPQSPLHVNGTGDVAIQITNGTTGTGATDGSQITVEDPSMDLVLRNRENATIRFLTNNTERGRFDASGRLLVGTSTFAQTNTYATTQKFSVAGDAASGLQLQGYSADQYGIAIDFSKSRGASVGTNTIVQNNDSLGNLYFNGYDGLAYKLAASIIAAVDGTPGANDMPGRIVLATTADGASTPTERMRISSSGTTTITGGGTGTNNNFLAQNSSSARILALRDDGYTRYGTATNSPYNFGVSTSTKAMFMDNGGGFGFNSSIRASKTNIETAPTADWINNLDVVTFNYRLKNEDGTYSDEAEAELRWGVIAENAEQVNPDFCSYDSSGKLDGFHYDRMIPVLLKAIQELKVEVADLKAQLS